jgi:hypothetical protein
MTIGHAPHPTKVLLPRPRREDRATLLPHTSPIPVLRPVPPPARRAVRPAVVAALTALAVQALAVLAALVVLGVLQPERLAAPGPVPSPSPQSGPVVPGLPAAPVAA